MSAQKSACDVLREKLTQLEVARGLYASSIESLELMKLSGHQTPVSVRVGNRSFNLTYLDRSTSWMSKLIRGREMLMLGAKKIVAAELDAYHEQVVTLEQEIAAFKVSP